MVIKVFGDLFIKKQAFPDNRNMDVRKRKIGIFPKEIVHDISQKVVKTLKLEFSQRASP